MTPLFLVGRAVLEDKSRYLQGAKVYCSSAARFERLVVSFLIFLLTESDSGFPKLLLLFLLLERREFSSILGFHLPNSRPENRVKNKLLVNNRRGQLVKFLVCH